LRTIAAIAKLKTVLMKAMPSVQEMVREMLAERSCPIPKEIAEEIKQAEAAQKSRA
jgi:hypothetical protein